MLDYCGGLCCRSAQYMMASQHKHVLCLLNYSQWQPLLKQHAESGKGLAKSNDLAYVIYQHQAMTEGMGTYQANDADQKVSHDEIVFLP